MKILSFFLFTICTFLLSACSTTRAPSMNMLEKRADYTSSMELDTFLEGQPSLLVPSRTRPTQIDIYIHPHETIYGDYFRGGFVRSIVAKSQWELRKQKIPKTHTEKKKIVKSRLSKKKKKLKKNSKRNHHHLGNKANH